MIAEHQTGELMHLHGKFGSVSVAKCANTNSKVIVKCLSTMDLTYEAIMKEVFILTHLQSHPHIIAYIDSFQKHTDVSIVMEFCEMSLHHFIHRKHSHAMTTSILVQFIQQFGSALEYLQSKHVIHADLKPENVCFKTNSLVHMVIIDFGCALIDHDETVIDLPFHGTIEYASPEAFKGQYTKATDIWGMGMCLYEAIYKTRPFEYYHPHMTNLFMPLLSRAETNKLCLEIRQKGASFEPVEHVEKWMLELIHMMLLFEYHRRPTVSDMNDIIEFNAFIL